MNTFTSNWKSILALIALLAAASTFAQNRNLGGGSPGPFSDANSKVELADGETYFLEGVVTEEDKSDELYFKVNLKSHEWLANKKRVADPYYRLDNGKSKINLERYIDKPIALNFKAKGEIYEDENGKLHYDVVLKPLSNPKVLRK